MVASTGRILLADDEPVFLEATSDLIRRAGYTCDTARDGAEAAEMLRSNEYDLFIADIEMEGNRRFELIEKLPAIAHGLPVIIVTAFSSKKTAIRAVQLPVAAYLEKPVDIDDLLSRMRVAVHQYRAYRRLIQTQKELDEFSEDLSGVSKVLEVAHGSAAVPLETYISLSIGSIMNSLLDIKRLAVTLADREATTGNEPAACHLFACPRLDSLAAAVMRTVEVIRRTRNSFKSRELATLRVELERLLEESQLGRQAPKGHPARPHGPDWSSPEHGREDPR